MLNIIPNFAQERALTMLRRDWKTYDSFMMYMPTGSGKTGLAAFIVAGLVNRGMRVLFVAPYTILINQTAQRFVQYGLPEDQISFIWRDHPGHDPALQIQIASADTLIRRDFPQNIDLLIVDEAHLRKRRLLTEIERLISERKTKVIGLSGTPFSPFLGRYYQRLIKPVTIGELIQRGDLSKYEFFAPARPDLKDVKTSNLSGFGRDYNETQLAEIMGGAELVGDIVSNWLAHGENRPTICFCVNKSHAAFITTEFNRAGVTAEIMVDDTPPDERQLIIHRFEQGATKIIVNVGVLAAGFDSDVRCIIYARPTKSEIRWLQTLGRALRTAPGKDHCTVFDHSGTVHHLGFPDAIEYDELPSKNDGMKESASRKATEQKEKLPKECPECRFMKPAGVYVCPKCGFKPLAGEDVETDTTRDLARLNGQERKNTRDEMQSWWSQILFYQRQRVSLGKKPVSDGWCFNTFREKFGRWPDGLSNLTVEITPAVSNFIKHKQIAWAKKQKKRALTTGQVIDASNQFPEFRQQPGRKTS